MADLLKEFFKRDLSDAEEQALADKLAQSSQQSLRFAALAKKAYLKTGLPRPEGGGNGPGFSLGEWGPITLKLVLILGVCGFTGYGLRLLVPKLLPPAPVPAKPAAPLKTAPPRHKAAPSPAVMVPVRPGMVRPIAYDPSKKYEGLDVIVEKKSAGLVTVRTLDSGKNEVRVLFVGMLRTGKWDFLWDGKLESGAWAGPGSYTVEVQSDGVILNKKINIQGEPLAEPERFHEGEGEK